MRSYSFSLNLVFRLWVVFSLLFNLFAPLALAEAPGQRGEGTPAPPEAFPLVSTPAAEAKATATVPAQIEETAAPAEGDTYIYLPLILKDANGSAPPPPFPTPHPLNVDFNASPIEGTAPLTVTFTAQVTPSGHYTHIWNFGDGSSIINYQLAMFTSTPNPAYSMSA